MSSLSFKKDDYGAQFAKDTIAFLPTLQIRIPNSTFSLVVKGAYATIDYEDYCAFDSTGLAIGFEGEKHTSYSIDVEARVDLYKDALVKLYASAGFIYEKTKMEADMVAGYYSPYMGFQYLEYLGPFEEEYDGTAGIGHIGIEYFPGEWYLNAEIGYVGRIYKDDEFDGIDKAQAELSGTVGYYLPSNWRIDANVSYLTEAETLYIGGGVTFLF